MNRRNGWGSIGTALEEDDLKSVLGASAGARNSVLEQRLRETTRELDEHDAGRSARPARPAPAIAPRPAAAPRPAGRSLVDELERLGELRARGLITDEEFASCKRRLLASL